VPDRRYERGGATSHEFVALAARSRVVGILIGLIVLAIIVRMVVKRGAG